MGFGGRREQDVSGEVVHLVVGQPLERADRGDATCVDAHVDRPALCGCRPNQEDAHCAATVAPLQPGAETRSGARVGGTGEVSVVDDDEVGVTEAVVERGGGGDLVPAGT